jgi:hypothetical protein
MDLVTKRLGRKALLVPNATNRAAAVNFMITGWCSRKGEKVEKR